MRDRKLATRYARALYATLPDARAAEAADEFLSALASATTRSADLRDVLLNPAVARSARKSVLQALADLQGLPPQVASFLAVVVDHNRAGHLPEIAEAFRHVRNEAAGIVSATVETARPLAPEIERRTHEALEKMTGRTVKMQVRVDPALLGGAVARIGSKVYDGSLKTQLAILHRRMSGE